MQYLVQVNKGTDLKSACAFYCDFSISTEDFLIKLLSIFRDVL